MSYQVIARKYRPQRFEDVVGQEHVTRTLSQAIQQERIAHAYIFCGPRGTGKTTIARIFAKCLNCTGGPKVDYDESDPRCVEIAQGRSLDVLEIDGASNNGVEQVRELRETCKYAPASSKFKIYIIDEVHMLSSAAFNALLKTLEEPPEHVKFMFATTDPEKVLPTILSRCQRFDLRRIPTALIAKHLALIADKEGVKVDAAGLHAIARGAEGGMRDAESTLDQLISFCGKNIEEADVLSMFGLAAQSQLLGLAEAILNADSERALRELNGLASKGKDLGRLMSDLLSHVRNLMIYQLSRGDLTMLEVSDAEASALASQSKLAGPDVITRILDVLADTELKMRNAASRKIMMEVGILRAIEARNSVSLDAVLKQLQALRDGSGGGTAGSSGATIPSTASKAPVTPTKPVQAAPMTIHETPASAAAPLSSSASTQPAAVPVLDAPSDAAGLWQILLKGSNPMLRSALNAAQPVSLANHVFTIGFPPDAEGHMLLVDTPTNVLLFQGKLKEAGLDRVQFKFVKVQGVARKTAPAPAPEPEKLQATAAASGPATAPVSEAQPAGGAKGATARKADLPPLPSKERQAAMAQAPFNKEEFKNDPLIKKALEIFKGHLLEVRS